MTTAAFRLLLSNIFNEKHLASWIIDVRFPLETLCCKQSHAQGFFNLFTGHVALTKLSSLRLLKDITFLQKIEAAYPTKNRIHVFCDNASYYKNKAVVAYLNQSKIQLHFLPPYSPRLNPIERLWKWMRERVRVMYNIYYEDFENFKSAIISFLEYVSNLNPESVFGKEFASKVQDNFRPIGAPT